jgi:hypothetical protein
MSVPSIVPAATAMSFVAPSAPIPVNALNFNAPVLEPYKIAGIAVLSAETLRSSNGETIVAAVLRESAGPALDAVLFGSAAASSSKPAGLLNVVTPLTATTGGGEEAAIRDLSALAAAVAPLGGSAITFVASPATAVRLSARIHSPLPYPVLASAALTAGTVVAIAHNALAVAVDPTPDIEASAESVVHMDTVPAPISASGAAVSTRSLWQTNCVAIRVILEVSWALRASGAVAVVNSVTW